MRELGGWLRLAFTHGVGAGTALTLLRAFGSPEHLFGASHHLVAQVVGAAFATRLLSPDPELDVEVEQALAWSEGPGHRLLTLADDDYPPRLLDIADPPPLLFVNGDVAALSEPALAIVGSRNATIGGRDNAVAFAHALADHGFVIASGLAVGIDAAAHEGALRGVGGRTVAVLGTGIDRCYPAANQSLARRIPASGALLSEFPPGTRPMRGNFPRRNRLIAGLSIGVLVVEAARESGSLITARLAADHGREVFAVPGSIHSPQSRGCHQLIRDGARLVESVDDILSELRPGTGKTRQAANTHAAQYQHCENNNTAQNGAYRQFLEQLGWEPVSVQSLPLLLNMGNTLVDQLLLELELLGHLERLPGNRVRQLAPHGSPK